MQKSKKVKGKSKKNSRLLYIILITSYFLLLTSYFTACTPLVKEPVRGTGPSVRVLLATIQSKDSLTFSGRYILHSEEARYEFGERNKNLYILPLANGIQLYNQNRNLLYRQHFSIILEPADNNSRFRYRGHTYAGSIHFQPATEKSVYLINKIL
ncbi:MAG: hypothetical protein KAS58_06660, partial [Calditrichia bacterium]|nr:hypothetical protein [Calditrichia bacterium]